MWEVDWAHEGNTGTRVWARDPIAHIRKSREWHWVPTGTLRRGGVKTPVYRADSWEVDWLKRKGKLVWARNVLSTQPDAREWHWIHHSALDRAGIAWKPLSRNKQGTPGRSINAHGYVVLTRWGMTQEEIDLAEKHKLFLGAKGGFCLEHRLVAVKKYGCGLEGMVVRHLNGIASDNRPENLLLGTTQENTMDHNAARLAAMYWRDKYEEVVRELQNLQKDGTAIAVLQEALGQKETK